MFGVNSLSFSIFLMRSALGASLPIEQNLVVVVSLSLCQFDILSLTTIEEWVKGQIIIQTTALGKIDDRIQTVLRKKNN